MNNKPGWMRFIEALTLIFAIIAVASPFAAILLPAVLQPQISNGRSELSVSKAWVRPIEVSSAGHGMTGMAMNDSVTAAYMTIENRGSGSDQLISISTDVAAEAEIHQTQVSEAGIAQMIPQTNGVQILPNSVLNIAPGGYHVMLSGLTSSLRSGQSVVLRLTFASGTTFETVAIVSDLPPDAQ